MIRREEALEYHAGDRAGKIAIAASKPAVSPRDVRLAYLPGAVFPGREIADDPTAAWRYTARGNLVAVVTNGTAVPGLGDVGPAAAKPIQEGIALLFKRLADIDVFDLELDAEDPERIVEAVRMLEPTFGGINLKDIRAPEGLQVYDRLRETVAIPVFHENLYSTAVVAIAGLMNGLELADKSIDEARVVVCGAGTIGLGCCRLLQALGLPLENLWLYDINGLVHPDRDDLHVYQRAFARDESARTLAEGLAGADVFLGASTSGVLTPGMIRSMNRYPIVFAMATPEPEISYDDARAVRHDVIAGTSLTTAPNAIVDLLSFPYIIRGALDVQASTISETMMLAAARSLAELAREEVPEEVIRAYGDAPMTFGPEYLLPRPIDPRILVRQSTAVARQAMAEKVAARPVDDAELEQQLTVRLGTGRELLRQLVLKARQVNPRVVLPEGTNETILHASVMMVDEGVANPVLLGDEGEVREAAERLGIDLGGVAVVDPVHSPQLEAYAEAYHQLRGRRGLTRDLALQRTRQAKHFATMMLHTGDADLMIGGISDHYGETVRTVLEVIGPADGVERIASVHVVLMPKEVFLLADCAVNIDPTATQMAEIALLSARMARSLGVEPRVAMLSFSNFGSADHALARKVRRATAIAHERDPELVVEGELQLATALDGDIRGRYFPFSSLTQDANVLVFPDLQSGNLSLHLLEKLGDAVVVGPVLVGTRKPVHVIQYGAPAEAVLHLATMGALQVAEGRRDEIP
jgi:malate dehydrogenase (oxaloacetate-decarboxylating)(NADP+)